MPDRECECIRDEIFYQYAKLIVRSALKFPDGEAVKKGHYGFVKETFRDLKAGRKLWSDIVREDRQFVQTDEVCIFCTTPENIVWEHVVPRSLRVNERCAGCDTIQGIHNQIWCCAPCNSSKGTLGLYSFFRQLHPAQRKFYDLIPSLLEKKYLKTIYRCHGCAGTLDAPDLDGDGKLTVLDLDEVVRRHTN